MLGKWWRKVSNFSLGLNFQTLALILMTLFHVKYKSVGGAEKMIDVHSLSNSGDDHFLLHYILVLLGK